MLQQQKNVLNLHEHTFINNETGEIKAIQRQSFSKVNTSGDRYVKMIINDISALERLPEAQQTVLYALARRMDYEGRVGLTGTKRSEICANMGIVRKTLSNRLTALVKKGLVAHLGRDEYMLNPDYFGRGDIRAAMEHKKTFEISIKYPFDGERLISGKCLDE